VVLSGRGKVTRKGRKVGEVLPGDFFGELSALDGGPRSATVAAETPMRVLRLFRHTLEELLRQEPGLILKLLDGIVRRVREVDRQIPRRRD
jgi:CRP-like cAMP-binding protein